MQVAKVFGHPLDQLQGGLALSKEALEPTAGQRLDALGLLSLGDEDEAKRIAEANPIEFVGERLCAGEVVSAERCLEAPL